MLGSVFQAYFRRRRMMNSHDISYQKHMLQRQAEIAFFAGSLETIRGTLLKAVGARKAGELHIIAAQEHWRAVARAKAEQKSLCGSCAQSGEHASFKHHDRAAE
jgi:hypothetical protein